MKIEENFEKNSPLLKEGINFFEHKSSKVIFFYKLF